MILKIGMILSCNLWFCGLGQYKSVIYKVPTTIIGLQKDKVVVSYDTSNLKNIHVVDPEPVIETIDKVDVFGKYLGCVNE